jgi:hypothetical protein
VKVDAALGDVADRIAILRIKSRRMTDPDALAHVAREQRALEAAWVAEGLDAFETLAAWPGLCDVNEALWDVEDALREHERRGEFGDRFVELARSVYVLNDRRATLKRQINQVLGSELVEQKSYAAWSEQ